jgi:hypothetical protein
MEVSMNYDEAIVSHMRWKYRLAEYIDGSSHEKLDPRVVSRDDYCDLGLWLYEEGCMSRDPEIEDLQREHAAFHSHAGSVIHAVLSRKPDHAQLILEGPYAKASTKVVVLLTRLSQKADRRAA